MHFLSFFKTLTGKRVRVELKNNIAIDGTLHSVDQYHNVRLNDISVADPHLHPHLVSVTSIFIRGSVVRYMMLNPSDVDVVLLQDSCRRAHNKTQTTTSSSSTSSSSTSSAEGGAEPEGAGEEAEAVA